MLGDGQHFPILWCEVVTAVVQRSIARVMINIALELLSKHGMTEMSAHTGFQLV